ncbi:alpha-L-fucosidase 2 [Actinacidiphila yanglinensis]|uniref:Alpha-L-fucosidase 2 n=1 Tax=Actinacidiphila yanglinensis TaxID=310779 RepID=A0A1H6CV89_9ACTN|nr:glycoside hydrolase family 95 protein [Actinacidiphila yanglinensis]SEG76902.1 alpha-L-fucosidase 2 [Actinacidiphila yanglinensis]
MTAPQTGPAQRPSRRSFLALAGAGTAGSLAAFAGLPAFTAAAAEPDRPAADPRTDQAAAVRLWYTAPASADAMIQQGLPVGNGRIGALVSGDPAAEALYVTDSTLWTGTLNDVLDDDGQFPYERVEFGSLTQLAHVGVEIPAHTSDTVTGYRRTLDLSNGLVTATYKQGGATYTREVYASHPDDAIVLHLSASGHGSHTGRITLAGTHGETAAGDASDGTLSFAAAFDNDLRYAAAVTATSSTGTIDVTATAIEFTGCTDLTVVFSGGTDYAPDPDRGYRAPSLDPLALARTKARAAARHSPAALRGTHVADYRRLFDAMTLSLGSSSEQQRQADTWTRLQARAQDGAAPDPELEASYLQFGRYLMICGSRDSVPMGLQSLWLDGNDPDWMGDYHTDINVQMNYWMADRTALPGCFDAFTDYCLAQLPSWEKNTLKLFNDPRNRFRNSSGKVAGWAVAFSTNIHGGSGWWWHPAANAWLSNTLFAHYEYTQDARTLARIYPLLKGACEFWQARLVSMTVTDPATGNAREVLVDDKDWSPEQGPQDALGNTYSQELVWALFGNFRTAAAALGKDADLARTLGDLRDRLYLPQISPTSGWLEEWMSPDNLGEDQHRHLSPLIGFFPGDRITLDSSPADLVTAVRTLLTARGMNSYGWANAWRALCWARLHDAEKAYQLVTTNLRPSTSNSNGSALNLFDIYQVEENRSIFQIDANFGTPSAMVEMLVYSRPGRIELLPALPAAWADSGSITGVGARGGFTVDLSWRDGRVREAVVRSVGGRSTQVVAGGSVRTVRTEPGGKVTLRF